jgi:hypothetical protein
MGITNPHPSVFAVDYPYASRIDETDPNAVYQAFANPGALDGETKWAIKKITVTGSITKIEWAGGENAMTKEWDERATYTYS